MPHREYSLTALVVIESIQLFVLAPLAEKSHLSLALVTIVMAANVVSVLAVVWHIRVAVLAVLLATLIETSAVVLRFVHPTAATDALDLAAALISIVAVTIVLGVAVFGPGRVTVHRILGAIVIYLNVSVAFALAFRLVDATGASAFLSAGTAKHETIAGLIYFSFTTITTTGYGDIVPLDPFARSLANVESVIGQLFPTTLLARLITLEIHARQSESNAPPT